ncbi:unnamed protein product [Rotaria sp. Silwood1]|nr:unnamed protein product [Rotaria sp. Silwood1]
MFKRVLPDQHASIARCLGQIGYVNEKKGDLNVALDYYYQELTMEEQCLPFDHPKLSSDLYWIVDTYKKMGEHEKAIELCQNKLNIQQNRLGENHPRSARTLMIIANVLQKKDPNEAVKYYEKALSILENSTPPDYQTTSECLTCMTCLYGAYNMNEDALRCELKALDVNRTILSSDHIDIANNLRNIGISYREMNNPSEALRYFNESLSIYKVNYGSEHEKVKKVEADIATLNEEQPLPPSNMELFIPMINQLQHIFTSANAKLILTLPQIAVVGAQSAGKSSVLENIVGRDFLPRGGNMVTKRPLVLQLITSQGQEYAIFGHKPQQRFINYADVRVEIENDTKAVVREDMGVSNLPINLTIYSLHVVNLTLVDLPGMVKVPSQGQPPDIVKKIDDIILEYISNESCLILAVTLANIDILTSDALVMARSRDPMGKRTIGVLTKIDMMGKGHNARDVLLNKVVVLERGFIGVVLRGQRLDEYGRVSKELDIPTALEY